MTREEKLDASLAECIQALEAVRESVANHPIAQRLDGVVARAKAIELPQEPVKTTGVIKHIMGDKRSEERDPGEHEQWVAEQLGLADK